MRVSILNDPNHAVTGPPHLAYSSLMIFSTRLIMLPTVVSDGWAAVILLPSFRIISIRSPETENILVEIRYQ